MSGAMSSEQKLNLKHAETVKGLFDDFFIALCLFAERYVGDAQLAEDIVQECFIKLWQHRGEFEYRHQVKSFLYTSVRNGALNELEHQRVVDTYAGQVVNKADESFFRDHVIEEETYRMLMNAIDKLPGQTRRVMLLALEGVDNKEIAATLNIADGTVHTLKKIAYKRLRKELRGYVYLVITVIKSKK